MVDTPDAERGAEMAREHPALSVGLHFVDDGPDLDQPRHAEREFTRQLARFRELMRSDPTHVDSHHHVHFARFSTFGPLVAPLGVPLRGDGHVRYLGDFYAHPQPRRGRPRSDQHRFSAGAGRDEVDGGVQRARLPSRQGDRRAALELRSRARARTRHPDRARICETASRPRADPGQLPRLAPLPPSIADWGRRLGSGRADR